MPPPKQEPYEDGEADADEGDCVMKHFQEDTTLSDLTKEQAAAVIRSVASPLEKNWNVMARIRRELIPRLNTVVLLSVQELPSSRGGVTDLPD